MSGALSYRDALIANIAPDEARREIEKHGQSWEDFLAEYGAQEFYDGADVLGWLGY